MKAFIFDRDGTLIENRHYLSTPMGIKFNPCAFDLLRTIRHCGYHIFVLTNQSGVRRGYYSRERIEEIHREMLLRLTQEKIRIEKIFYCEHHPNERCNCRKPGDHFLKILRRRYDMEPESSYFVGDRAEDMLLGKKCGMKTVLLRSNSLKDQTPSADYVFDSLCAILNLLK